MIALAVYGIAKAADLIAVGVTSTTAQPTSTPIPSGLPTGVPKPQSGSWVMTIDDEFNQDSSVNTAVWNGGPGATVSPGYFPLCHPGGSLCGYSSTDIDDCLV